MHIYFILIVIIWFLRVIFAVHLRAFLSHCQGCTMSHVLRRPVLPLCYFGGHFAQHGLMVAEVPVPSHGSLRC